MSFELKSPIQLTIQKTIPDEVIKQDTETDVKFQNIVYWMHDVGKTVRGQDHVHIDFFKAMNEMENLNWEYRRNYVGFRNHKTKDEVQFIRISEDKWYADVPIDDGPHWPGYVWGSIGDSKTISEMVRLFFEEMPWFGMLSWKSKRTRYAKD